MSRKAFHQLLQQYLNCTCTPKEKDIIEYWHELIDHKVSLKDMDEEGLQKIEDKLWEKIATDTIDTKQRKILPNNFIWMGNIAACLLMVIAFGIYYFNFNNLQKIPSSFMAGNTADHILKENKSDKAILIKLEDNSEVLLQPSSVLTYPKTFALNKRKVFLSGEAFFKVSKNDGRPFYVYNKNTIVKVLGTSFNVIAKEQSEITEVAVRTGKVIVLENKTNVSETQTAANEVALTPNQKVIYDSIRKKFEKKLVDIPLPVSREAYSIQAEKFVLSKTPLKEILFLLEQVYDVEIIAENKKLNNCKITGDISSENLYDKLDIICQSLKSSYLIDGTKIYINGKGCK